MTFQISTYSIVHGMAGVISLAAAVVCWRRRSAPGGRWLFMMLVGVIVWSLSVALDASVRELEAHILFGKLSYLGGTTVTVLLLLFALEYSGYARRLTRPLIAALFAIPAFAIVMAFTNELHGLVWTGFTETPDGFGIPLYHHGPIYWLITAYGLLTALAATALLLSFAFRTQGLYRNQGAAIIIAILIPWVAHAVYSFAPRLLPGLDSSVALSATGVILTVSMVRFKLLDLVPVAREMLVESMTDGLLVLDESKRIVYINPAAQDLFEVGSDHRVGQSVKVLLPHWPEAVELLLDEPEAEGEHDLIAPRRLRMIASMSALKDRSGRRCGTICVFKDITARVKMEETLRQTNEALQSRLREIEELHVSLTEQAIQDPLTGLYNRRYLSETLDRELGRASREGYPVSLVMVDVDGFKRINDEHGHPAGDLVLRFLGSHLRSQTRPGDIACRYGGDEFLLVLPNTSAQVAARRGEQWLVSFGESGKSLLDSDTSITASLGVAEFPAHGATAEQAMAAADAALYAAKAKGRNSVVVWSHLPSGQNESASAGVHSSDEKAL